MKLKCPCRLVDENSKPPVMKCPCEADLPPKEWKDMMDDRRKEKQAQDAQDEQEERERENELAREEEDDLERDREDTLKQESEGDLNHNKEVQVGQKEDENFREVIEEPNRPSPMTEEEKVLKAEEDLRKQQEAKRDAIIRLQSGHGENKLFYKTRNPRVAALEEQYKLLGEREKTITVKELPGLKKLLDDKIAACEMNMTKSSIAKRRRDEILEQCQTLKEMRKEIKHGVPFNMKKKWGKVWESVKPPILAGGELEDERTVNYRYDNTQDPTYSILPKRQLAPVALFATYAVGKMQGRVECAAAKQRGALPRGKSRCRAGGPPRTGPRARESAAALASFL